MELMRTYSYKIDVKKSDLVDAEGKEGWLASMVRTHWRLYNDALEYKKHCYEKHKDAKGKPLSVSKFDLFAWMAKRRETHPYMRNLNSHSLRSTLTRLDLAYQAFFRRVKAGTENPGFPKFKSLRDWDTIAYQTGGWRVDGHWLVITKCGDSPERRLRIRLHRPLPEDRRTMMLTRKADGWHMLVQCAVSYEPIADRTEHPPVGIDVGIKSLVVTSDGEEISKVGAYRKAQAALRRAQRKLSRSPKPLPGQKSSNNRRDAIARVAKLHQRVANVRKDAAHKAARTLVDNHAIVAHEALNIKGLAKSALALDVNDAAWGQLLGQIKSKAEEVGTEVIPVDPRNTSQDCSGCGTRVEKTLATRVHKCPSCGLVLDRDHNAARNILARAMASR